MLATIQPANHADDEISQEDQMLRKGVERYQRNEDRLTKQGAAAERRDISSVIARSLLSVGDKVSELVQTCIQAPKQKQSKIIYNIKDLDPYLVAYITLTQTIREEGREKTTIALSIGHIIECEINFHQIAHDEPKLWKRLKRYAQERGSHRHKVSFVYNTLAKDGKRPPEWSAEDRIKLGTVLLMLVERAGLIEYETIHKGIKTVHIVSPSQAVLEELQAHRDRAAEGIGIKPLLAPMTSVPVPWTSEYGGGYQRLKRPLIKPSRNDRGKQRDLSRVIEAVNIAQSTAYRLNPTILSLVQHFWSRHQEVGKLPAAEVLPLPSRMSDDEWAAMAPEEQKGYRIARSKQARDNREAKGELGSISIILEQAEELIDAPALYIPHELDFRGRIYASPSLNPQGPDYIKALFEFAQPKPVDGAGAAWIAIQLASLWDGEYEGRRLSKSNFESRIQWVLDNGEMLASVVNDPIGDQRWMEADKPFMFLRTAMEWVDFCAYDQRGEEFQSHLIIFQDASCSGCQHFSAMLRDSETGERVNLIPGDLPRDVYGDVAQVVIPRIEQEASNPERDFWLEHGLSRKVLKRPVMTYGYSSRLPGFTRVYENEFILPYLKKTGKELENVNGTARYLAKHTLAAAEETLPAVKRGMDWLMEVAGLLSHEGKPVEWTTSSGFCVSQRYPKDTFRAVETSLEGQKLRVFIPNADPKINKEKQKSAIAPNFVHSYDAAHLVLTVLKAHEVGVESFALIHDSFGTHVADAVKLAAAIREAFVEMYETHDPFEELYYRAYEQLSEKSREKLPLPPDKGDLDLTLVLQSLYSFA